MNKLSLRSDFTVYTNTRTKILYYLFSGTDINAPDETAFPLVSAISAISGLTVVCLLATVVMIKYRKRQMVKRKMAPQSKEENGKEVIMTKPLGRYQVLSLANCYLIINYIAAFI